ncbi:uncharacterized protein LOC118560735 [Fundulus heteroclitus]|uniref:uncharacterized protein LOC118560735 n=1 Tax=Fundulus heteroclitus TaxID=8078 RepID=UPI00165C4CFF|nr:uncharacterized protein LOC118560735 [Fundulus heteroclitus]
MKNGPPACVCFNTKPPAVFPAKLEMPRGKGFRRTQAFKRKMEDPKPLDVEIKVQESTFVACQGTGTRHRSRPWPTSSANNTCKLVIPPESKDKKFVFLIGDSHLRAIVDGFAPIKEESLYFGFLAVPGGAALDLRTEILNAVIPRIPDLVCLLAPSNTLKRSTVVSEAGKQFKKLLTTVCTLFPKVFVLDFPPRLNVDPQVQSLLRQEFHRVSVQLGVSYKSVAELFPMRKLHLWSRDGVHLSDDDGMKILNKAIYEASHEQIHKPTAETEVMPTMSCSPPKMLEQVPKPTAEKVSKLLCTPEVPVVAPQDPFEWNIVGSHNKTFPASSKQESCTSPKRVLHLKVEEQMDFSVELNPKWFDGEMLEILGDGNTPTFGDASIAPFQKTKASPTSSQHQSCASPKKAPHLQVEEELEQFSVELNPTAPFQKTKGCDRLVAGGETVTKNGKRSLPYQTLITRVCHQ